MRRENALGTGTIRNYASDLDQFLAYFSPPDSDPPSVQQFDALAFREWLGDLYQQNLSAITMRRKLAAVRSFFRFLMREGTVPLNAAKLLRTPKAPKMLPRVMTAEQTNTMIDQVAQDQFEKPFPERDLLIFELLYGYAGCASANSCGLNLDDFDYAERWVRVRGKGRKERQVPFGSRAAGALERYLPLRRPASLPKNGRCS